MAINIEKVLPPNLVIQSAEDLLYDIGLCLTSVKRKPKERELLSTPIVIWIIQWVYLFVRLASILTDHDNKQLTLLLGDVGEYIGLTIHWDIILIFGIIITILSQLNFYFNYKQGNEPTFLRVFQMMSGSVTPVSIGLYRVSDIRKLTRLRILFKLIKINSEYVSRVSGFLFVLIVYIMNEPWSISLTYGLLSATMLAIWIHSTSRIEMYQFVYFFILCSYLKIKLKNLNNTLNQIKTNKRFSNITKILCSYDFIYREIYEYNTTYWSKFFFIVWLLIGALIAQLLFICIFIEINMLLRLLLCYSVCFIFILFNFIFLIACSLNTEANKSYRLFNSLIPVYSRSDTHKRMARLRNVLKVIL